MPEPLLTPFAWVTKRDGRLVPFEADKISRALFAATESLGRPDAFLARELTDGVLHFLGADGAGIPTTDQIADTVIKVVRELGQPAVSQAFAEHRERPREGRATGLPQEELAEWIEAGADPEDVVRRAAGKPLQVYSLGHVFARDLAAAHAEGLLTLGGLETPLQLDACVLGSPGSGPDAWRFDVRGAMAAVHAAGSLAGNLLAVDGLEHALASGAANLDDCVAGLATGLRATGLRAVVNLNCATPPSWADDLAEGPLFAGQRHPTETGRRTALADALLETALARGLTSSARQMPGPAHGRIRIDWHLGEVDFHPADAARLLRLARLAVEGAPVTFTFDRPRRPIALGEGLDRDHPAVLLQVGLNLPGLLQQLTRRATGIAERPEIGLFLQKLGSLVRLALSAAVQKRAFLRRHRNTVLNRAFLLDRACLVVVPVGLEAVARSLGEAEPGERARQIVQQLHDVLRSEGDACRLNTRVDSAGSFRLDGREGLPSLPHLAGLTFWDRAQSTRSQVRSAGLLHATAGAGTAAVLVPADGTLAAEDVLNLLRYAWQQTQVIRLRLVRTREPESAELPFRVVG